MSKSRVCEYFLRGGCRYGNKCFNEHPGEQTAFNGGNNNKSWNRSTGDSKGASALFTEASMTSDLDPKSDKPLWPLSSYAPAKYEPQLVKGFDESPEELRTKAVTALQAGNINQYLQYESTRIAEANRTYEDAKTNVGRAFAEASKNSGTTTTSNTKSVFGGANSGSLFPSTSSAFGNTSTTTPSAFGNNTTPSVFGSNTTPSAFGSTSAPTPSAFGTPANTTTTSVFGKPAFGAPSAFGQPAFGQPAFGKPAFGQTTAPAGTDGATATTSVFGQPQNASAPTSVFGQPPSTTAAPTTSVFGQPAFGQPSAFGQAANNQAGGTGSSFIKPASGAFSAFSGSGASPFGSTATPSANANATPTAAGGAFSAFAGQQTAFGLGATTGSGSSTAQTGGSVFGQPAFGQPVANPLNPPAAVGGSTSVFAAPGQGGTPSVFGGPAGGTTASVFGQPSTFGQQQQPAQPQQPASVFGTPAAGTTSVFGTPAGAALISVFGTNTTTSPSNPSGSVFGQSAFSNQQKPVSVFGGGATQGPVQPTSVFGGGVFGNSAPQQPQPGLSAFAPTAPSISMQSTSGSGSKSNSNSGTTAPLDFSKVKASYKPGSTPYDSTLPPNYPELLPKAMVEAFKAVKFEWGKVPEWVPPVDIR